LKLPEPLALAIGAAAAPRALVAEIASQLIELLDFSDGDAEAEDEEGSVTWPEPFEPAYGLEVTDNEDEPNFAAVRGPGPGCPIADPDGCAAGDDAGSGEGGVDDGFAGDADDGEWARAEVVDQARGIPGLLHSKVDYDDDDEDSESDFDVGSEDEPDLRRRRRSRASRTRAALLHGPGCPIGDPGGCEHNGAEPDFLDGHSAPFALRIPLYGNDQSCGPQNEAEIGRAYAKSLLEGDDVMRPRTSASLVRTR
jgi:hypothetical protein